jgi:hypothetical protein
MGRPPLEKKQRQLAVALPPNLRSRLEAASAAADHSLAEEIRIRLVRSFDQEVEDKPTRDLAAAVTWLADEVSRQSDLPWYSNPNAQKALAAAIQEQLEITAPPYQGAASDLFGPGDPPTLGRSIARSYQRLKTEMEKTYQEILRRHTGDKS